MNLSDLPVYARNIPSDITPLFESKEPELAIYEMKDLPLADLNEIPLLTSFNDFESKVPFWRQNERGLSREIKYAGALSNRITEFSSTFDYPLDSIQIEDRKDLLIQCTLNCFAVDETNARIVISLEDASGTSFWKALDVNSYLKAYSNWWPVNFDVTIPRKELDSSTRLKIYVWKTDQVDVYIDNFQIIIL